MRFNRITISKVSNGYIIRDCPGREIIQTDIAVFNDVDDLGEWIKENFQLEYIESGE